MRRSALIALLLLVASSVHAAGPTQEAEARSLFDRGKEAMNTGRFAEASGLFQRSLDLVRKPSAAFNLAVALRGMGRPKESSDVLAAMLHGDFGELPAEKRREVEKLAAEAERDIAKLTISAHGAEHIDVRVDGARVGTVEANRPLTVDVNPGERVVTFSAKFRESVEKRATLAPGKSGSVSATLELSRSARRAKLVLVAKNASNDVEIKGIGRHRGRIERRLDPGRYVIRVYSSEGSSESAVLLQPATDHRVELDPPSSGGVLSSPWFWIGAGVLVTGAVVTSYVLLHDREKDPVSDPEFKTVQTLRGFR